MKKVAFILLGAGHEDGSEITEAISAWVALTEFKAQVDIFSFDLNVPAISNPEQKRNALVESQRISRGVSKNITELNPDSYDALVIPGGTGLLLHLTDFPTNNIKLKVNSDLEKVIQAFHQQSKPIGAICIAPLLVGKALEVHKPLITLGEVSPMIDLLKQTKIDHEMCPSTDFITDRECKIVSTPAYMNDKYSPFEIYTGIRLMVKELVEMA